MLSVKCSKLRLAMGKGMGDLPYELVNSILDRLSPTDKLVAAFTCRKWMYMLRDCVSGVHDLRIVLEDNRCVASVSPEDQGRVLCICMCLCPLHASGHIRMVHQAVELSCRSVERLVVEDYLLTVVTPYTAKMINLLMQYCPNVKTIELHQVYFGGVSPDLILRTFCVENLSTVIMDSISSDVQGIVGDALLVRLGLRSTLCQLSFTNNPHVTDKALQSVAFSCASLTACDFSGCVQVTSQGICHFVTTMNKRHADMLHIKVANTSVDSWGMQRCLGGDGWAFTNLHVLVSAPRSVCIQNKQSPSKAVLIMS